VAVKHGDIPGFMPAMTMDYPVENREVLSRISVGDEIAATVYIGDPTLHDLRIVKHDSDRQRR
jgi:Cu/Ag efflux protein CusF